VGATGRILAIDYGSRRMGLAVTDPLGITAQGIETLQRKNKRADFGRLERTIREYEVKEIVLGNPLRMSGQKARNRKKWPSLLKSCANAFNCLSIFGMSDSLLLKPTACCAKTKSASRNGPRLWTVWRRS
jgi:RNase H-fold protein (predicted Holliday junction resolvase)